MILGNLANSSGLLRINAGSLSIAQVGTLYEQSLTVGLSGSGTLEASGGTISFPGTLCVGDAATSTGTVTISNGSVVTGHRYLWVGSNAGTGVVRVSTNGSLRLTGTNLELGGMATSYIGSKATTNAGSGTLIVDGGLVDMAFIRQLAFSPDGTRLVSASEDGTTMVWAVPAPETPAIPAVAKELPNLWQDLASPDAWKAYVAACNLVRAGDDAVAMIKRSVQPAEKTVAVDVDKRVSELVPDLDKESFAEREKAQKELQSLGRRAMPALKEAAKSAASAEVKSRIETVLNALLGDTVSDSDSLRAPRAISVLARIGTLQSEELLKTLAGGDPSLRLTVSARAASDRLAAMKSR